MKITDHVFGDVLNRGSHLFSIVVGMVLGVVVVVLSLGAAAAENKCGIEWCQTFPGTMESGRTPPIGAAAWFRLVFVPDAARFFIYTSDGPYTFSNSWWSYGVTRHTHSKNPWIEESASGTRIGKPINLTTATKGFLGNGISATDTTITLHKGDGATFHPDPQYGGVLIIDNEEMGYTENDFSGDTFKNVKRGIRSTKAESHASGALVNSGAPFPQSRKTQRLVPVEDHLPDRHPFQQAAYDSERHQLFQSSGIIEGNKKNDTWYFSLEQNEFCPASDVRVWKWLQMPTLLAGKADAAMAYDSDDDVMIFYGGQLLGNPTDDTWILCFKADPQSSGNSVGCPSGHQYPDWVRLSAHSAPGPRLGHVLVYDSFHHKAVLFGGTSGASKDPDSIWLYTPAKRAWTEAKPRGDIPRAFRRPGLTYDSKRHLVILYEGPLGVETSGIPGGLYTYDVGENVWKLTEIKGGPVPSPGTGIAHGTLSIDYDPQHDVFVGVEVGRGFSLEAWELPGEALDAETSRHH